MSKTLVRFLASSISALTNLQSAERAERNRLILRDKLTERHSIETKRGPITLICNNRREVYYAHHFLEHEPSTIKWIDNFEGPCTFWDIGANTGIYSLYAALRGDVHVYAYEPGSSSHSALYNNIHANSLDNKIIGLCMGFFNESKLENLYLSSIEAGAAMHNFGNLGVTHSTKNTVKDMETVLSFSIDDFRKIFQLPAPTYLKIDVDGAEEEILFGAKEMLKDNEVRSILVEMINRSSANNKRMTNLLKSNGFEEKKELSSDGNVVFSR